MNISSIISPFNFPDRTSVQPRIFFYNPSVKDNKQKTDGKNSPRRAFTARQKEELNRFYMRSPYPSFEEREQLASRFQTSSRHIQVWFQNQRSRWEKLSPITD
ncbi:retinal homeobox protein Rx2-like [Planoprotostelium fungivorum]|uniref:Retinal homeobox protein Rx2-like n=1 Tax=Planoprotostelium fungivorum TaxID=1890364 RepID=A0A2P6NN65_9EUKA|nr:retinal homeobox protein Rx2-like [Planoprotostelium fungivorum]